MKIVIPVTPKLAVELAGAESYLARVDTRSGREQPKLDGQHMKDRLHFDEAAGVLEGVARAMLDSMAAAPLTGRVQPTGARVAFRSGDSLNTELFRVVDRLRCEVSQLLEAGTDNLDQWSSQHTRKVLDDLMHLYAKINSSIQACAKADLATLQDTSLNHLLEAAGALARAVDRSRVKASAAVAEDVVATAATATRPRIRRIHTTEGTS
jgi:hypothetical protein